MGGTGSTRWQGHQGRLVAEQVPAIRLDRPLRHCLKQALAAAPTMQADTLLCYQGRHPIGICGVVVESLADGVARMHLSARVGERTIVETLSFELAPQPLGGLRAWWRCPGCDRRCTVLYLPKTLAWRCRTCYNILYTSNITSDLRISDLLACPDLVAELDALMTSPAIGDLVLISKVYDRITRQAQREFRRWWRRTHPHRHMPRRYRR
jgi:hypothetical protein